MASGILSQIPAGACISFTSQAQDGPAMSCPISDLCRHHRCVHAICRRGEAADHQPTLAGEHQACAAAGLGECHPTGCSSRRATCTGATPGGPGGRSADRRRRVRDRCALWAYRQPGREHFVPLHLQQLKCCIVCMM